MKKETKTIIIGTVVTLLALVLAILIFYLIARDTPEENENNNNNNIEENNNISENNTEENNNTDTINTDADTTSNGTTSNNSSTSSSNNSSENTVTIYLFRGEGCHFCENAIEFFEGIIDDYSYLEIKAYEVWRNEENKKLMDAVATELDIEVSASVPLIIVGDTYARRGFSESRGEDIIKEVENSANNDSYIDIVDAILNENGFDVTVEEIN